MSWYLFAFLSPLLWAVSNHIDKYILSKYLKNANTGVLAIFAGLVGFLFSCGVAIFSPGSIWGISIFHAIVIILNGALLIVAYIPYYYALNNEDASSVVPLYQLIPIFTFVLGFILFRETISQTQIFAGILIIIGAVLISIDLDRGGINIKKRVLLLMSLSSLLISIHFLVFKFIAVEETFLRTVFWEYIGAAIVAIFLLLFITSFRNNFVDALKENSIGVIFINLINEVINITAKIFANYASLFVPVVVVNLANGLQPFFVFVIGIILTLTLPFLGKEKITRKFIIQRTVAIVILFVGTYFLVV